MCKRGDRIGVSWRVLLRMLLGSYTGLRPTAAQLPVRCHWQAAPVPLQMARARLPAWPVPPLVLPAAAAAGR